MTLSTTDSTGLVDAHCHVDLFRDPSAIARVVTERRIHTIAVTNVPSVFEYTELLARKSRYLHASVGLHPELIPTHGHEIGIMWPLLERTRFVGEIGLDYSTTDANTRLHQRTIFTQILEKCAVKGDKIITVHSRRSATDVIDIVGNHYPGRIIMHWFSGSVRELQKGLDYGLYFSVNPAMLNSQNGRAIIECIPKYRILTESDGPLGMAAGQPASPTSTGLVVSYLSKLWQVTELEVAQTILRNSGLEMLANEHQR